MPFHPEIQCLETLKEHPCVERAHRSPEITQTYYPCTEYVCQISERFKQTSIRGMPDRDR